MQWIRRSFIAGFFVTVPLFISVAAFLWLFRLVDGLVGPVYAIGVGAQASEKTISPSEIDRAVETGLQRDAPRAQASEKRFPLRGI